MKKVFYLFCLVVFAMAACGKKTTPYTPPAPAPPTPSANSFSIQGDSFKNSSISIRTFPAATAPFPGGDSATYDATSQTTSLTLAGLGSSTDSFTDIYMNIEFAGDNVTPGGTSESITSVALSFNKKNGSSFNYTNDTPNEGSIIVTSYGKVGQPITGTFKCTGIQNGAGTKRVNITNGKFSVNRIR